MNHMQSKLENPTRLAELNPMETLLKIGLQNDQTLCDIGAGSGIFTIPAALFTKNLVYALEKNKELLSAIDTKARQNGITNIRLIEVRDDSFDIEDETIDIAIMVTVLHEIDNKATILEEVKRMLKPGGKFAVIEFHKRQTTMGPPMAYRIAQEEITELLIGKGFVLQDSFDLGENLYCVVCIL